MEEVRDELTRFGFAISKCRLWSHMSCATIAVDNKSRAGCCWTPSTTLAKRRGIGGFGESKRLDVEDLERYPSVS